MSTPLYFDHNMQAAVADGLRARGIDVLTAQDDGRHRDDDEALLDHADSLQRVIVTHDQDFLRIANARLFDGRSFGGIVYCGPAPLGALIEDLEIIASTMSVAELRETVVWVPI
jgi:hypothetical protein